MATYDDVVKQWTPAQWQKFGSMGGIINDKNELVAGVTPESIAGLSGNAYTDYMNQSALGGLTTQGTLKDIGTSFDIIGDVANLAMFPDKYKSLKMDIKAKQANLNAFNEQQAAHKQFINNFGGGFNQALGSGGLAATAAAKSAL